MRQTAWMVALAGCVVAGFSVAILRHRETRADMDDALAVERFENEGGRAG